MKTIRQALIDWFIYPIPEGLIENCIISRGLDSDEEFTSEICHYKSFQGCLADCLVSLVQSVNFSEADKSVGVLSDEVKKSLLVRANSIYKTIGEDEVQMESGPMVYINC